MYTFALAAGINDGHLNKTVYLPVVERAWAVSMRLDMCMVFLYDAS
jgi:hypothetical protein